MKVIRRFRISQQEAAFLDASIQSGSPIVRKQALQRLCNLYRSGGTLIAPRGIKALVLNSIADADHKVRRWAFNGLAQLGERADVQLMLQPWCDSRQDFDVFEAGLTALAHILSKEELIPLLRKKDVDIDAGTLMALGQQSDAFIEELSSVRLNIDSATIQELRAATLLIGLNKAPDTLFSGRFPVSDIIGDLNSHDDPIVAQYSFWATVEHPQLGLANVRIHPSRFPNLPPNVQGWAFRTLTKDGSRAVEHYDAIVEASQSSHVEVREGVAIGIREIYYDSLDTMVSDWIVEEVDGTVVARLLEHMASHAGRSSFYRDEVLRAYRTAGMRSLTRSRLEAASRDEGTSLVMRRIALQTEDPDLFASMVGPVTNNTQTFNATVNTGGISNSGTGNSGEVQINSIAEAEARAVMMLHELFKGFASSSSTNAEQIKSATEDALKSPTKGKVARVVAVLKQFKDGGEAIAGMGKLAVKAYDTLGPLLDHLTDI